MFHVEHWNEKKQLGVAPTVLCFFITSKIPTKLSLLWSYSKKGSPKETILLCMNGYLGLPAHYDRIF